LLSGQDWAHVNVANGLFNGMRRPAGLYDTWDARGLGRLLHFSAGPVALRQLRSLFSGSLCSTTLAAGGAGPIAASGYTLREKALELGWSESLNHTLDRHLGKTDTEMAAREGFKPFSTPYQVRHHQESTERQHRENREVTVYAFTVGGGKPK